MQMSTRLLHGMDLIHEATSSTYLISLMRKQDASFFLIVMVRSLGMLIRSFIQDQMVMHGETLSSC